MSPAKIRVTKLAHVHYQHPDLEKAAAFLLDFGMIEERRTSDTIYFRGYDEQPYLYVAEQSKDGKRHFLGGYWVVDTWEDLEKAASLPNASEIQVNAAPGGGRIVTAQDPHGNKIGFVYGQELRIRDIDTAKKSLEKTPHPIPNEARTKVRRGEFRRFEQGPSLVHKAGHYGFGTTPEGFEELRSWYTTNLNLVPTDSIFNPETGKDESTFFHIDLGSEFTDHHSFFLGADPKAHGTHVHHSSFEVNDFDTQLLGHYWLQSKGWTNCWGVGRHVLGSQIFDYWFGNPVRS
ncbi:Glyoxalase/Bleomycin resistance protein/Dihydroxybiphenyl dioxygenase [Macrophomina phaseolina]|uniref:Glyoxalase/Bleomycin resistance protein/Dihydroxybiphenyl dioxygenase n=1 Tax=Macrophomina phaseolina TaxID=35725 RepID=A0ABQ8FPK4_9PEZI|nr:Glyoxalase/Bleomycin resistance protein/Dihydroxybiphenyl dioxygenase [Macrophomina phaseolina]